MFAPASVPSKPKIAAKISAPTPKSHASFDRLRAVPVLASLGEFEIVIWARLEPGGPGMDALVDN